MVDKLDWMERTHQLTKEIHPLPTCLEKVDEFCNDDEELSDNDGGCVSNSQIQTSVEKVEYPSDDKEGIFWMICIPSLNQIKLMRRKMKKIESITF